VSERAAARVTERAQRPTHASTALGAAELTG
jgi:hypothetical protein